MASQAEHLDSFEELENKYELLEVLGGGGMGRVIRARHRQLKQHVAIKLLQRDLAGTEATSRFLREARAVAQIHSPHVARVMDAGLSANGQPFIVMEYLSGRDLAQLVGQDGPLSVVHAVGYILQALEAIAEAHALGIIHRDLKPSNLFQTRLAGDDHFIKVLDFGLAKLAMDFDTADPLTERGSVLGTPSYMAPEQFVDAQSVDTRSDIWSVGATLFQLISGLPPFRGSSLPQLYSAVMHGPIPRLKSMCAAVPDDLDRVIATCLERERNQRYQSVAELARALEPHGDETAASHVQRILRVAGDSQPHDRISIAPTRTLAPREPTTRSQPMAAEAKPSRRRRAPMFALLGMGMSLVFAWLFVRQPAMLASPAQPRAAATAAIGMTVRTSETSRPAPAARTDATDAWPNGTPATMENETTRVNAATAPSSIGATVATPIAPASNTDRGVSRKRASAPSAGKKSAALPSAVDTAPALVPETSLYERYP